MTRVLGRLRGSPFRLAFFPGTRRYQFRIPGEYFPCNPSIAADGDGFLAIVRTVNYWIDSEGIYRTAARPFNSDTINWLVELDSEFRVRRARIIDDRRARNGDLPVAHGLQDARLFHWRGGWWFVAAAKTHTFPPSSTIALCRLEGNEVAEWRFILSPLGQRSEKNWMPRVSGNELKLVYRASPMQIMDCRGDRFEFEDTGVRTGPFDSWSGSSQFVRYRDNWLGVVHVRIRQGARSSYEHAFLEIDRDFRVMRFSDPWVFCEPSVEFCAGLCIAGDDAVLGYGRHDREAHLLRLPLSIVEGLLRRDVRSAVRLRMLSGIGRLAGAAFGRDAPIAVANADDGGIAHPSGVPAQSAGMLLP